MTALTCPYCYHQQSTSQLHYVCPGNAAPGFRDCSSGVDEQRAARTGYRGSTLPTFPPQPLPRVRFPPWSTADAALCPGCGGRAFRRACESCHTPLPTALVARPGPLIGMVGGTWSGKTVFLTVLNRQLREAISTPFEADVHLIGEHQVDSNSIHAFLERYEQALFQRHLLVEKTQPSPTGRRVPLVLQWRQRQKRWMRRDGFVGTILSFCDAAGEDILSQSIADRQRYLRAADGLIILIDAYQLPGVGDRIGLPQDYEKRDIVDGVLSIITETLKDGWQAERKGRRLTLPVALVVSKMDVLESLLPEGHFLRIAEPRAIAAYDGAFGENLHTHVRSLLEQFDAGRVHRHMEAHYENFRYFAISSLGALPDYERGAVNARGVTPRNVAEPLLWLMSLKKIIRTVTRA